MLVSLFRLLSHFPLPILHVLGAVLGRVVYAASPTYRLRLQQNIERAGYGRHLKQAVVESGKGVLELPFIWFAPQDKVLGRAKVENWELAQQALDAKKG